MEHKDEILKKTDRSYDDYIRFINIMKRKITFYPNNDFKKYLKKASLITPDPDDTEYIALALYIRASIWTNDKSLKRIKEIDVYSTGDLIRIFED